MVLLFHKSVLFSDDAAIVGCISQGNDLEYRKVITNFVDWCELNHLHISPCMPKQMMISFSQKWLHTAQVNIQNLDRDIGGVQICGCSTVSWTGHATLMPWTRRTRAISIQWEDWGPLECADHCQGLFNDCVCSGLLEQQLLREGQEETQQAGQMCQDLGQVDICHGQQLPPPSWVCGRPEQLL